MNYDLIISVSTYKSNERMVAFLDSLQYLHGKILVIVTAMSGEPIGDICEAISRVKAADVMLFVSSDHRLYFCINWAYLFCNHNGIRARYFNYMPDGMVFLKGISENTIELLDETEKIVPNCITVFPDDDNGTCCDGESRIDGIKVNPHWINSEQFIKWELIERFGLFDMVGTAMNPFYSDMELVHRMRYMSGLPYVANVNPEKQFHYNHRQNHDHIVEFRNRNYIERMDQGARLWRDKYGLSYSFENSESWIHLWNEFSNGTHDEQMKRHLLYNGLWLDFESMYLMSVPAISLVMDDIQ